MNRSRIVVVARRSYQFVVSGINVPLQITKIRFDGSTGFVREWRKSYPGESFHLSSNARLGHKADGNRMGREVLELAILKRFFTEASCAIAELDAMDREVLSSNRWSFEYATSVWNSATALAPRDNNQQEERTTTMSWQEEIKAKTLEGAVKEIVGFTKGELVDNETYEDVDQLNKGQYPDVIKLHRVWVAKKKKGKLLDIYCADLHEYDNPKEPFFVNRIMSLEEGPWGWQPPAFFGGRQNGGDKIRKPSKKYTRGSKPSKQFVKELQASDAKWQNSQEKEAEKIKASLAKNAIATRKKTGGKYLDKKQHKLIDGHKAACGKPVGVMEAGKWSGGVRGRDSWHFVDCKECLAVMPATIHKVDFGTTFGCMERYDDTDGKRWKEKSKCGGFVSSTASTTDQHGGVNCMRCLAEISPHYREHHVGPSGKQTSTLCGAKTNSMVPYGTDCWWLVSCPDCYRMSEATTVHPMQEEDVQLLLQNSMIAARNQGMKPTQEKCISCSDESVRAKTKCLACAVLTKRGISTDDDWENKLSKLFNLPYEWVMDLLKGWDGDKAPELTYPTAFKLGKKLWRKHG